MNTKAPSYEKVHYALRPAKQVERRMFVAAFQHLMKIGFPLDDYHYLGMGSVYFVDFIVFHKYLGISSMTSVEKRSSAKSRLEFNKPFGLVDIRIGDISNHVCSLSPDRRYLVWLDYDCGLDKNVIKATKYALANLSPGSILLVTVDAMPPGGEDDGPQEWLDYFTQEAGAYLWVKPAAQDFTREKVLGVNLKILQKVIDSGIVGRDGIEFSPLFNLNYRDGHEMLTIGGMITSPHERDLLRRLDTDRFPFLRTRLGTKPCKIRVPLITQKERLHLDTIMPTSESKQSPGFSIKKRDLLAYEEIYRYYPAYAEMYM